MSTKAVMIPTPELTTVRVRCKGTVGKSCGVVFEMSLDKLASVFNRGAAQCACPLCGQNFFVNAAVDQGGNYDPFPLLAKGITGLNKIAERVEVEFVIPEILPVPAEI